MELTEYLRSKSVEYNTGSGQEIITHCFWCPDGDTKGKGKLYLNVETWLYNCKRCDASGNKKKLYEHFGDQAVDEPGPDPQARIKFLEEYVTHTSELLFNNDPTLLYLLRRGLSEETITKARLGFVPRNYGVSGSLPSAHSREVQTSTGMVMGNGKEFLQQRITIPYTSSDAVVQIRGKDPDGKYVTPPGQNVRLYNVDALRDAEKVIVTEGEFDCLILQQNLQESTDPSLRSIAVVGIAGANALPEGFENYFPNLKRIYAGFDNDPVGRKAATNMVTMFGSRCRTIVLPQVCGSTTVKDWTDFFLAGFEASDVADLITDAEMRGKRIFSVREAGLRWQQNLTLAPGIQTGFPQLDSVIHPGIRAGNVVVALAKTGTGKTVLLSNLAYNMRERRVLFVTLEMMADEIYGILRRIVRFHHPTCTDDDIHHHMPYLRIVDENRLTPEDFALLVEEYKEEVGQPPEIVFIDYLGYYARGMRGGSPYEKTSNAVMQLKEEAKRHELAVIAPHQVNRTAREGKPIDADEARDSGVVEETADFVFGLYRPSDADEIASASPGMVTAAMQLIINKSRRGGKGKVINLNFSYMSLAMVDSLQQKECAKVSEENTAYNQGVRYEDLQRQQCEQAYSRAQLKLVTS